MPDPGKTWKLFEGSEIPSSVKSYPLLIQTCINRSIIDFGCGFGKTCFEVATAGAKSVLGVDINQNGINFAKSHQQQYKENLPIEFLCKDATNTELANDQFDLGIMQAFLTTLPSHNIRIQALTEARRLIKSDGGLYLAVFMQTWHSKTYRERYEKGLIETGEEGSFWATDTNTNKKVYQAHHFSEKELIYLLNTTGFEVKSFTYEKFQTRTGNYVNGAVIWAE
ncbi:class I SAM-dependent methyltransferase [Kordiimonas sp. SCSIO 12603]|uniref:class I SAM-dependent methyltransferase n=1 Tax=Kordiimonas sp. SCSIO 12603 TaxID=2829596 RepID=UPI0021053E64|nr:class I SAM-dependent methyltransferase [Kordiimonas sp. SCSIO 12603]UTW59051.1 class I SAM-dependent methyltransferase [Kordiimonas sp. SCSIO 12603]